MQSQNDYYCIRFFNAFTFYITFITTVLCTTFAILLNNKAVQPIQNIPLFDNSSIKSFLEPAQISSQLVFPTKYLRVNPAWIYIPDHSNTDFYMCDPSKIDFKKIESSTKNISQRLTTDYFTVKYNGIGSFCIIQNTSQVITYKASRQPYSPAEHKVCYDHLDEDLIVTAPDKINFEINYMTYNRDLCVPVKKNRPDTDHYIIGFSGNTNEQINFNIKYRQDQHLNEYYVLMGFAITAGVVFGGSIVGVIWASIKFGSKQAFLFIK
ncbi:Hypothetical_protein [Hexamita inflata]|uniref:Hypothetical_protein n=1 Tax=Hexamita inflata TaxID=28002 RepID=A0AA86U6P4_9EUKA|nr:Hypothetical protein HINF_LOCUS28981 [Hexamita inflata]